VHLDSFAHRERGYVGRLDLGNGDEQLGLFVATVEQLGGLSAAARAISISAWR